MKCFAPLIFIPHRTHAEATCCTCPCERPTRRPSGCHHQEDGRRHGGPDQHGLGGAARLILGLDKAKSKEQTCWNMLEQSTTNWDLGVAVASIHLNRTVLTRSGGGKAVVITAADPAARERAKVQKACASLCPKSAATRPMCRTGSKTTRPSQIKSQQLTKL